MSRPRSSYQQVLRSTSLIGGATAGSILIGLIRMKVFALLIGPAGIGLLGLLAAVQATAAALAGMGTASSGVRYLTAGITDHEPGQEREARWNYWALTLLLAIVGGLGTWLFRIPIARLGTGRIEDAPAIGWLALAVAFSIVAGAQLAILQAHRQIADIARVQIGGALLGMIGGVSMVSAMGMAGVVPALVMVPLGTMIVALGRGRGVPPMVWLRPVTTTLGASWLMLLALGATMMVSGFIGMATQIAVRSIVVGHLGLDAAGLYQAGWTISVTNIGLVLTAMAADYFPRLSAVAGDPLAERELVNQQLHVGLLICAPLVTGLIALAPLALHILYSAKFEAAAGFLRWQMLGDIFKLGGWALGYVMIARNDKFVFLAVEASFAAIYLPVALLFTAGAGLDVVGAGYALAYALYFLAGTFICARRYDVVLDRGNIIRITTLAAISAALIALSWVSAILVAVAGVASAIALGLVSLRQLAGMMTEGGQSIAQRGARWISARWRRG